MGHKDTQARMVAAQKRLLRARLGFEDYRAAQRAWARARKAQRRAWDEKAARIQSQYTGN